MLMHRLISAFAGCRVNFVVFVIVRELYQAELHPFTKQTSPVKMSPSHVDGILSGCIRFCIHAGMLPGLAHA